MRLTTHNGRGGQCGAYLASHNDRRFDINHTRHINPDKIKYNIYWNKYENMGFEDAELLFYKTHFSDALQNKNNRYIAQRHTERMQTIKDYYKNLKTCPEESIFQIGSIADGSISADELVKIYNEFKAWREKFFPAVHVLNWALHMDEKGAPHIHERLVWIGHDRDGNEIVSQNKALQEMGICRPDTDKCQSRYNNPKQSYTKMCREGAFAICQQHGINIIEKPRESSKSGLSQLEYQVQQTKKRLSNLQKQEKDANFLLQVEETKFKQLYDDLCEVEDMLHLAEKRKAFEIYCDRELERTR